MTVQKEKKYALLLAAKDSDYVSKVYGGYFNVFMDALADEGEKWDLFRVIEGEFPEANELEHYDGFVISGSPHDAYGNELWILELCFLLRTLFAMQKKVLGVCFGHQILCRALGGKVARSSTGWDLGIRTVRFTDDFYTYGSNQGFFDEIPETLAIIECHQDEVWEVPVGGRILAYSDKTEVEMFAFGDHIFGFQGHPEYTKDILDNIIDRLVAKDSVEIGFAEEAKLRLAKAEPDRKYWERICRRFLKGEWSCSPLPYFR